MSPFRNQLQPIIVLFLRRNRTINPAAAECVPLRVVLREATPNPEAFITKLQHTRAPFLFKRTSNRFKMNRLALPSREN